VRETVKFLDVTRELLELAGERPSGDWIDCGCGAGETVRALISTGVKAVGVDLEPPDGPEFVCADYRRLPFGDNRFDGAIAECSLSVSGDAFEALSEIRRALVDGGRLLVGDVFAERENRTLPTVEGWREMIASCGFVLVDFMDVSTRWRARVAQALWNGEDVFGGFPTKGIGPTGYALFYAIKRG
jgi:SAM-dependent methyltransferase